MLGVIIFTAILWGGGAVLLRYIGRAQDARKANERKRT